MCVVCLCVWCVWCVWCVSVCGQQGGECAPTSPAADTRDLPSPLPPLSFLPSSSSWYVLYVASCVKRRLKSRAWVTSFLWSWSSQPWRLDPPKEPWSYCRVWSVWSGVQPQLVKARRWFQWAAKLKNHRFQVGVEILGFVLCGGLTVVRTTPASDGAWLSTPCTQTTFTMGRSGLGILLFYVFLNLWIVFGYLGFYWVGQKVPLVFPYNVTEKSRAAFWPTQ